MKILIDTSIWSLALRRNETELSGNDLNYLNELKELMSESRAVLIGPIRQEILSGITREDQFNLLKTKLSSFQDYPILANDYEMAAYFFNLCRKKGIQGSHIDFLICAVSSNNDFPIFTLDNDFFQYIKYCNFSLHKTRF